MPIPKPKAGQDEQTYVSECIPAIIDEYGQEQASAICYATYEKESMSKSKFSKHKIETQMKLAKMDALNRGIRLAEEGGGSYPWDECIADQEARYGDEETAKKVCGYIKSEYGS
jgi:hypothetical protein